MSKSENFKFDGGAATYLGTGILSFLLTVVTLGLGFPWALCMKESWKAKHTFIEGKQLSFNGSGGGLFFLWIKWAILIIITLGIYTFWVVPDLQRWKVEHTDFN